MVEDRAIELGEKTLERFKYLIHEGTYSELLRIYRFLEKHEYKIKSMNKRFLVIELINFMTSDISLNDLNKYELVKEILNNIESRMAESEV